MFVGEPPFCALFSAQPPHVLRQCWDRERRQCGLWRYVGETGSPAEKAAAPGILCVDESRIPQGHQLEPVSRDRVGAWQKLSERGLGRSGDTQVS